MGSSGEQGERERELKSHLPPTEREKALVVLSRLDEVPRGHKLASSSTRDQAAAAARAQENFAFLLSLH